jgi:hypothetical protein
VLAEDLLHASVKTRWDGADPQYRPTSMGPFLNRGLGGARFEE